MYLPGVETKYEPSREADRYTLCKQLIQVHKNQIVETFQIDWKKYDILLEYSWQLIFIDTYIETCIVIVYLELFYMSGNKL